MPQARQSGTTESRVEQFVSAADLRWVSGTLAGQRDEILQRWLDDTNDQPFHAGRHEQAVADHIPHLFDAIVALLQRTSSREVKPDAAIADGDVLELAQTHAHTRLDQGLDPVDVVVEFRLLRQEILAALRRNLPNEVPAGDLIAAEMLVNDALDGAISVALRALTAMIEEVRENFLATTIHDVRQPLTLIKGSAQFAARLLSRPEPNIASVVAELERIDANATRMTALLNELVDVSRITLQRLDLDRTPVNLVDLVRDVAAQLPPEMTRRITLHHDPEGGFTGQWDQGRLEQVLRNLLSNAVKYSPPDTPIEVNLRAEEDFVHLAVRDHGIGIAPEELPRLFQRYSRARSVVEQGIEGIGLGLFLCRGIVESHGGRIWASSDGPGTGSTLHVVLPCVAPDPAPDAPQPDPIR